MGPGFRDFLDLLENIFFLMKYPVGRRPPRIEFFLYGVRYACHARLPAVAWMVCSSTLTVAQNP
jgi:hypothetical protein